MIGPAIQDGYDGIKRCGGGVISPNKTTDVE